MNLIRGQHFSSFHMILFGFAEAILLGTLLLMLPFASASGWMGLRTLSSKAVTPNHRRMFGRKPWAKMMKNRINRCALLPIDV